MKKKLIVIIILLCLFGVMMENQIEAKQEVKEENNQVEAVKEEVGTGENEEEVRAINELSNEYTGIENLKVMFNIEYTEGVKYYLTITAYNQNTNEVVWEHKTNEYYVSDKEYITYVFDNEDNTKVYLLEENNINLLNMNTGKIIWTSKIDSKLTTGISLNNKLYVMGPYESTIYVVNQSNGTLINKVDANVEGYDYEIFTTMEDIIIIEYNESETNYLEFNTANNTFIK